MLVLFTDTDTDITPAEAKEFGYHLISMPYSIDGETTYPYEDFETFDAHAFYDQLRAGALPNTSAISTQRYTDYFEPIFKNLFDVEVCFRASSKTRLVRAADIVANHWYHCAVSNQGYIEPKANAFIYVLPGNYASSFDLRKEYEPRPWIPERNAPRAVA